MISLERRDGRPSGSVIEVPRLLRPSTLRSFRAAVEVGVDLVEFDVLDLRSGELVIAHSNDLRKVSHGAAAGAVRERSLQNLKEICPELPTLEEALAFFADEARHVGLHLDLKTGREANVAAAIRRFDLVEQGFRELVLLSDGAPWRGSIRTSASASPSLAACSGSPSAVAVQCSRGSG